MPEIAEVARIVHFLKKYLVGRILKSIQTFEDGIVYKDTTHELFKKKLEGNKVVDARQLGKYFWLVMESSPHPLMHFGMTGWVVFQKDPTTHYRSNGEEKTQDWPPKFVKFILETEKGNDIAFVDPRRLARIRLIDEPTGDIRKLSPLKENGPDPVIDGVDEEWFKTMVKKKKVPVKGFLLDQKIISGVGNWVGDEILYHAHIHPEQYCNTLSDAQIKELHRCLLFVTKTAVSVNGDSAKFPTDWLFLYRWGKGKSKNANTLPNGEKIDFVTVGGRTSAYVKTRQKATASTAVDDVKESKSKKRDASDDARSDVEDKKLTKKGRTINATLVEKETKPKKVVTQKVKKEEEAEEDSEGEEKKPLKVKAKANKASPKNMKAENSDTEDDEAGVKEEAVEEQQGSKKTAKKANKNEASKVTLLTESGEASSATGRRSARHRK